MRNTQEQPRLYYARLNPLSLDSLPPRVSQLLTLEELTRAATDYRTRKRIKKEIAFVKQGFSPEDEKKIAEYKNLQRERRQQILQGNVNGDPVLIYEA